MHRSLRLLTAVLASALTTSSVLGTAHAQPSGQPEGLVDDPLLEQEQSGDLVMQSLFSDDGQWRSLVVLPAELEDDRDGRTRADAMRDEDGGPMGAAAGGGGGFRGSLDADLVTQMIADRAKQLAMAAVVHAIQRSSDRQRRFVTELIQSAAQLLLARGGVQRTYVERLIKTIVRLVLSEVIVRTRFPLAHRLDRSDYWERRVCAAGTGHRRQDSTGLELCARLRMGLPEFSEHRPEHARQVHLYLLDLTYWQLGRTGLFGADGALDPPECPFQLGEEGSTLCQVLGSGSTDEERNHMIRWTLNIDGLLNGLMVARTLQTRWAADGTGLRGFLRTLLSADAIGTFEETPGLRERDWAASLDLVRQLQRLRQLQRYYVQLKTTSETIAGYAEGTVTADNMRQVWANLLPAARGLGSICGWAGAEERSADDPPPFDSDHLPVCRRTNELVNQLVERNAEIERAREQAARGVEGVQAITAGEQLRGLKELLRIGNLLEGYEDLFRRLDNVERILREGLDLEGEATVDVVGVLRDKLQTQFDALGERIWPQRGVVEAGRQQGRAPRSIGDLGLDGLGDVLHNLFELENLMGVAQAALSEIESSWDWTRAVDGRHLLAVSRAMRAVSRMLRLFSSLNLHAAREANLSSITSLIHGLESLGLRTPGGGVLTPVLDLVEPVIGYLVEGRELSTGIIFHVASQISEEQVLAALGVETTNACAVETSLGCWTVRIVHALHEATQVDAGGSISIDGSTFRTALSTLGEDFRARNEWRWYFHLTVGLGELGTFMAAPGAVDDAGNPLRDRFRLQPIVAEQIGFGLASPSFFDDQLTFRAGLFGSGLLFRAVMNSEESKTMMFGAFAALDLYQLLQVYIAPMALVFPSSGDNAGAVRPGVAVGVSIPLGDYLTGS